VAAATEGDAPRMTELIARKRDGGALTADELRWVVTAYLAAREDPLGAPVSEAQVAALLMAGVIRGFDEAEALALTEVFVDSGDTLDLTGLAGPTVDKHSTGGVGDGTTLLVAPLLAAAGAQVVKLSGRGLGHTGGTLDKLEAIPGMRVGLEPDEMRAIAERVGCVVAAQTDRLVPADRAFYALRDVTGTTPSMGLIASSVMAKKLASGAGAIVLDVKAGSGAFMPTTAEAGVLAALCVRIATAAGRRCAAVVSAMDVPLGRGIGNALEVAECVHLLRAAPAGRLAALSLDLAAVGLALARDGRADDVAAHRAELEGLWRSGAALERLRAMIAAQGGDPAVCDDPAAVLPVAPVRLPVPAEHAGHLAHLPGRQVGELSGSLGAGRSRKEDDVDPAVGIALEVEVGDAVEVGQPLAVVHAADEAAARNAVARLQRLVTYADAPPAPAPTLLELVT
jgi:pyrimidine-nucleoside phosphorylase